jgi:protein-L-isoaspartate(D-aspartate) O-methyltransferase
MTSLEAQRHFYARFVTAKGGTADPRLVDAFGSIWREQYVRKGPWSIEVGGGYICSETDDPTVLYQDFLVGLNVQRGINNGQPSLHAKCIGAALPQPNEVVLQVGAGTGYYTAILAHLVGPGGRVYAYEIDEELAREAARNLAQFTTVTVRAESALETNLPSVNVIYVCAGATHVPLKWLDALTTGGRLVLPLTTHEGPGCMLLVTQQSANAYCARILCPAWFIPCIGARRDDCSRALAAALETRTTEQVRSLRRGSDPDETAWCIGEGWWLSTVEAAPLGGTLSGGRGQRDTGRGA